MCHNCSLVFVYPFPERGLLSEHYDRDYYQDWVTNQSKKRARMWLRRLKAIEKIKKTGTLLDVGCGDGSFLKLAQDRGWNVYGTELSAYAVKKVATFVGNRIFCGELGEAKHPGNMFDVVTLWHVLEHVTDPAACLAEIQRIIKPDGLLVLAVPNIQDFLTPFAFRLLKGRRMKLFSPSDREIHLYHFSVNTLQHYLEQQGFHRFSVMPDFGIIDMRKKIINYISLVAYYLIGYPAFSAIEMHAEPKMKGLKTQP
jgi:2-polyprenyl-3-methyl-5-hydroxy-6-metoxy-1,4-benzoquinol methylase